MPKRRANGEGNIRKRKDGRWEGRYTAGYDLESGKRIIKNVLGKTQAEVKEKFKAAISESQRLDVSKAGTYTVSSWVKTWYEVYAEPRIRPNTKAYYTNYIENHIIPRIGSVPLNKLTTIQIQRFYNNLQKTGREMCIRDSFRNGQKVPDRARQDFSCLALYFFAIFTASAG